MSYVLKVLRVILGIFSLPLTKILAGLWLVGVGLLCSWVLAVCLMWLLSDPHWRMVIVIGFGVSGFVLTTIWAAARVSHID